MTLHVADHRLVAAREVPQAVDEIRVRQAPHVEHEVRIERHAVLVAKTHQVDHHFRPGSSVARHPHENVAQLVHRQVRGVEDQVRHRADGIELLPLLGNALAGGSIGRQRMRAPRLAEPAHERGIAGFEEDERRLHVALRLQLPVDARKLGQEASLPYVDDDGDFRRGGVFAGRQLRHRGNQLGWQVVHAEVAQVLEGANRLRLAGAGEARQDDKAARAASTGPCPVAFGLGASQLRLAPLHPRDRYTWAWHV